MDQVDQVDLVSLMDLVDQVDLVDLVDQVNLVNLMDLVDQVDLACPCGRYRACRLCLVDPQDHGLQDVPDAPVVPEDLGRRRPRRHPDSDKTRRQRCASLRC